MFFYISIIVSLVGLLIATYTDLKERIVTNKLNFGLAITGLLIYTTQTIFEMNIYPILYSVFGLLAGFFFGWVLWKLGIFAGGDVKLFMALGALNPFTPALLKIIPFTNISIPIFPISLFFYSLVAFLPYGLTVLIYKLIKNKNAQKEIFLETKKNSLQAIHASIIMAGLYTIINMPNITMILIIFFGLIIWQLLKEKKKFVTIIVAIIALIFNYTLFIQSFIGIAITLVLFYGIIKLLFSMKVLLSEEIKISELEEGMIPAKTLVYKGNKIIEKEFSFRKIIDLAIKGKINELFIKENEIVSSMHACGVTNEEIKLLKKLAKDKKISNTIMVKDSMPFVPTMLLGYIICLFLGDAIIFLLGGLI